jgi:uncharacterized protein
VVRVTAPIDLRKLFLRVGDQTEEVFGAELGSLELGGQTYKPKPSTAPATVTFTRTTSGLVFRLQFGARLTGPCFRCLEGSELVLQIDATEYEDADAGDAEELQTTYVEDQRLDLAAWAHDAVALAVPEKILCVPDCAGLCPQCGTDLNRETCDCTPPSPQNRWQKLEALREQLAE